MDIPEFKSHCLQEFAFLLESGFERIQPPKHRRSEAYQVWFARDDIRLVIKGEGYGTAAAVHFEDDDSRAAEI